MKRKRIENWVIHMNEEIGKGSFGHVYKGHHELSKQSQKNKQSVSQTVENNEYVREALVSEIKIMQKLKSHAIVGFLDILETTNNYYIVQELCDGGDLKSALHKSKHFSEQQAINNLKQICTGYQELITNSIIHRDIKPQNVLINKGKLKLADFGFAKYILGHNTMHQSMVGTPLYMAPQILKREKYTSKCDVWSMGLLFYQMLFGCLPWVGQSEYQMITLVKNKPLTFPANIPVSQKCMNFLRGCLQPSEENRFSWLEVYEHPIFQGFFDSFTQKNKKLNQRVGYVIHSLRVEINTKHIDIFKLFNSLKRPSATSLNKLEFFQLLRSLDKDVTEEESKFVFLKFDEDGSGFIDFQEFKRQLQASGVRTDSTQNSQGLQRKKTIDLEEQKQLTPEQIINRTIIGLREKLEMHNLDPATLFNTYRVNQPQAIQYDQFSEMLNSVNKNLSPVQMSLCFQKFDQNGDGKVSFGEFYRTLFGKSMTGSLHYKEQQNESQALNRSF